MNAEQNDSPRTPPMRRAASLPWLVVGAWCMASLSTAFSMSIRELHALEISDKRHGPEYVQYYLVGAMEGALEANAQAVRGGAKPIACLNGRRLEPRMEKPLFDAELKRNAGLYEADMPVQLVLVNALSTAYTC